MPNREKISARWVEAFAEGVIALQTEVAVVALRTFAFRTRADGNAVVFEEDLGDGPRRHSRIFPDTTPWRTLALLAELSDI